MNTNQTHEIAKKALVELDQIFKSNNISYFLLSGSTLGAVRHKDMIPWDDDIDIGIFCKDEENVAKALINGLSSDYSWIDLNNDKDYPRLHGKILYQGIGVIDIFPLVKTSDSCFLQRIQWCEKKLFHKLYKTKKYNRLNNKGRYKEKNKVAHIVASVICMPFSEELLLQKLKKVALRYENIKKPFYYINIFSVYSLKKERILARWLSEPSYVFFGNGKYPTVNDCDAYLKNLYGDYMVLPPVEKRKPGHPEIYGKEL